MAAEYTWRASFGDPRKLSGQRLVDFIDSRFLDVITNIAWGFGFSVHEGSGHGRVRIPGETHVYINKETREVDFSEVPESLEVEVATAVEEAMEKFYEWEETLRGE